MIDALHEAERPGSAENLTAASATHPPILFRYQAWAGTEIVRQVLVFESAPLADKPSRAKGMGLVEFSDGRVFFFRTSMEVLESFPVGGLLLHELLSLPEWIDDWAIVSARVGFSIGAALEFPDGDPRVIENWNIPEWERHAMSWMAINQPDLPLRQISQTVADTAAELADELKEQIARFARGLNQQACEFAGRVPCSWQHGYNYFNPADYHRRLYRKQALRTFPLVVHQFHTCLKDANGPTIRSAIDEGRPLVEELATIFGCSKASVRHLNGMTIDQVGTRWSGRLKELLTIINGLDLNRLPTSQQEWEGFGQTINLLSSVTRMPITAVSSRLLLGELSNQNWSRKIEPGVSFQERALTIERFIEFMRQSIIAMVWSRGNDVSMREGAAHRIAAEQACSLGIAKLERLARRWNTEQLKLDSKSHQLSGKQFPVLLDEPLVVGDLTVIQLTDHTKLVDEGRRMKNCVASYGSSCLTGNAYIFSVRNETGKLLATVEYALKRSVIGSPEFKLVQQKGFENADPPIECREAFEVLHQYVISFQSSSRMQSLLVYQKAAEKGGANMAKKYCRALEFIGFLDREIPGRFDFVNLAADSVALPT